MESHPSSNTPAPPWTLEETHHSAAAERVRAWWERARTVTPPTTLRAWRFDWAIYLQFCAEHGAVPLPATPQTVAAFIDAGKGAGKKPATVRRYLSTIALAHRVAKLENPCPDEAVQLAVRGLYQDRSARQRQARAMGRTEIKQFLESAGDSLPATRERALICVAYDTMARRSELVALDWADLEFWPDGTGRAHIRRSKTDQTGEGHLAYLSRETVRCLLRWRTSTGFTDGAVFRRVVGRERIGKRLSVDAVAEAFKRVARWIGMTETDVTQVSGHSIRVGATQDLLALNIDLASVMQAGRWKTNRMPMRYGEHVLAARGGMARAAAAQGRDGD